MIAGGGGSSVARSATGAANHIVTSGRQSGRGTGSGVSGMVDREKVNKGLETCTGDKDCTECPYEDDENNLCDALMMADALALLKEQEAHVMSREEMIEAGKNHDAIYVEDGTGRCFWGLAVEGIEPPKDKPYNYPGGVLFNAINADEDMWDGDFYLMCDAEAKPRPMGWRAWNKKPTDEQRKAVKWNG